MHDDTHDDLDFAMLTPPTRPGPCKAAATPEVDPVEARLEREAQAAPHLAEAVGLEEQHDPWCGLRGCKLPCGQASLAETRGLRGRPDAIVSDRKMAVEVRHGSGKVNETNQAQDISNLIAEDLHDSRAELYRLTVRRASASGFDLDQVDKAIRRVAARIDVLQKALRVHVTA